VIGSGRERVLAEPDDEVAGGEEVVALGDVDGGLVVAGVPVGAVVLNRETGALGSGGEDVDGPRGRVYVGHPH